MPSFRVCVIALCSFNTLQQRKPTEGLTKDGFVSRSLRGLIRITTFISSAIFCRGFTASVVGEEGGETTFLGIFFLFLSSSLMLSFCVVALIVTASSLAGSECYSKMRQDD